MGGARRAIEQGFQQREIADAAYRFQRDVEDGRETVVGVNAYAEEGEAPQEVLTIDPAAEESQVERLAALRAGRDGEAAGAALDRLRRAAGGDANLMPPILDAVRAEATLGEIADALRQVFGEHRDAGFEG